MRIRGSYGITIEETKIDPNLFPHIPDFFEERECPVVASSNPISLTLRQLPTSLVRLLERRRLDAPFRAIQN